MEHYSLTATSLTIIADQEVERLDKVLHSFSGDWVTVPIGREISTFLITQNEGNHSVAISQWIDGYFRGTPSDAIICYDIDFLFLPSLNLDPLAIFQKISRYKRLVVLWPGSYRGKVLSYAQPGHNHYKHWKNLESIEIMGVEDAL